MIEALLGALAAVVAILVGVVLKKSRANKADIRFAEDMHDARIKAAEREATAKANIQTAATSDTPSKDAAALLKAQREGD